MQLYHQFHILAHRTRIIPLYGGYHILAEQAEGTRYDEIAVKSVHKNPGRHKGTIILKNLHPNNRIPGHMVIHKLALLQNGTV